MSALRLLLALAAASMLSGCGGGGNGGPSAPTPPVPRSPPLLMYFGVVAKQLEEDTGANCVYSMDWGNWDTDHDAIAARILNDLRRARVAGINCAVIGVGFTLFSARYQYGGASPLVVFRKAVEAAAAEIPQVVGVSLIDEPDLQGVSDEVMTRAINDTKAAWPGVRVFVVYGAHGTPGRAAADVIGRDAYPGLPTLDVAPHQAQWIFPGGASPWRVPPDEAMNYVRSHPECAAVCAFMWGDRPVGQDSGPGIRSNGLADAYRQAFKGYT